MNIFLLFSSFLAVYLFLTKANVEEERPSTTIVRRGWQDPFGTLKTDGLLSLYGIAASSVFCFTTCGACFVFSESWRETNNQVVLLRRNCWNEEHKGSPAEIPGVRRAAVCDVTEKMTRRKYMLVGWTSVLWCVLKRRSVVAWCCVRSYITLQEIVQTFEWCFF